MQVSRGWQVSCQVASFHPQLSRRYFSEAESPEGKEDLSKQSNADDEDPTAARYCKSLSTCQNYVPVFLPWKPLL